MHSDKCTLDPMTFVLHHQQLGSWYVFFYASHSSKYITNLATSLTLRTPPTALRPTSLELYALGADVLFGHRACVWIERFDGRFTGHAEATPLLRPSFRRCDASRNNRTTNSAQNGDTDRAVWTVCACIYRVSTFSIAGHVCGG